VRNHDHHHEWSLMLISSSRCADAVMASSAAQS
jgi:hypothetical protein